MHHTSVPGRSSNPARRHAARGLALAAVVGVTMLGNLRLQASEVEKRPAVAEKPSVAVTSPVTPQIDPQSMSTPFMSTPFMSMLDADRQDDRSDEVRLVPAIYAWNPDVRFVYFRHVSKWM